MERWLPLSIFRAHNQTTTIMTQSITGSIHQQSLAKSGLIGAYEGALELAIKMLKGETILGVDYLEDKYEELQGRWYTIHPKKA